ncbi:MAG: YcfL family protein [Oleiphilaceae bacterium]|nr:YcfL family protein [Oleiphilaceae bacterium]
MNKRPLVALPLLFALLTGCAVNETATVTVDGDTTTQVLESNSGFLSASLEITETKVGSAGDLMKVQATLKNASRSELSFRYKFKWLDKDGFEIAVDGRPWTPLTITPYESKSVQATAPNPTAKAFRIMVQD